MCWRVRHGLARPGTGMANRQPSRQDAAGGTMRPAPTGGFAWPRSYRWWICGRWPRFFGALIASACLAGPSVLAEITGVLLPIRIRTILVFVAFVGSILCADMAV